MTRRSLFRSDAPPHRDHAARPSPSRALMLDHFRGYLETTNNRTGRPYAPKTIQTYVWSAGHLATWLDSQGRSGDLSAACAVETLNAYLADYFAGHGQNGAAFQYKNLRTLFNWLEVETGISSPYKSKNLNRYTEKITKPKVLDLDVIRDILATCNGRTFTDVRDLALIRCLLEGMRASEVLAMSPQDVPSPHSPVLRVKPLKADRRYSEDSGRRILLSDETLRALQRWQRKRLDHPLAENALSGSLWLSTGRGHKNPMTYSGLQQMLVRRTHRAFGREVDGHLTAHMFRHTFASDWMDRGGSVRDLVEICGWVGPQMAYRYGKDQAENRAIAAKRRMGSMY